MRGHPFMTSTKNDQIFDPHPHHPQKGTIDLLFKNNRICKHVANLKKKPLPFRVDVVNVCSLKLYTCS